jgi:hypothetical protein
MKKGEKDASPSPSKGHQTLEPFKDHQTLKLFKGHQALEPFKGHQKLETFQRPPSWGLPSLLSFSSSLKE